MTALIVVSRGASATFQHLQAMVAQRLDRDVELIWDRRTSDRRRDDAGIPVERRVAERRAANAEWLDGFREARHTERRRQPELRMPERRQTQRRRPAPDTWGTLGFLVLRGEEGPM